MVKYWSGFYFFFFILVRFGDLLNGNFSLTMVKNWSRRVDLTQNPSFWLISKLLNWTFYLTIVKYCMRSRKLNFSARKLYSFFHEFADFLNLSFRLYCAFLNGYFVFKRVLLSALSAKHHYYWLVQHFLCLRRNWSIFWSNGLNCWFRRNGVFCFPYNPPLKMGEGEQFFFQDKCRSKFHMPWITCGYVIIYWEIYMRIKTFFVQMILQKILQRINNLFPLLKVEMTT